MIYRVTLTKSWTNKFGRVYPIGQIITATKELCQELVSSGNAITYGGPIPPVEQKRETDFFKPKNKIDNGNGKRK